MKPVVTAAFAALLVGGMSIGALGTVYAQAAPDAPAQAAPAPDMQHGHWQSRHGNGMQPMARPGSHRMGRGAMLALACGDHGAEALEIALVHLYYRVKPTETQQPLYDALKTAAVADQKTFAQSCKPAGSQPTILDRLQDRLALEQARATALGDVVPKFRAFYDSLTSEQKAKLDSPRHRPGMHGMRPGWQHNPPMPHPGAMQKPGGAHQAPASPNPSPDPASSST